MVAGKKRAIPERRTLAKMPPAAAAAAVAIASLDVGVQCTGRLRR